MRIRSFHMLLSAASAWFRRRCSVLLCLAVLLSFASAASAEEDQGAAPSVSIRSIDEFLAFAEGCSSDLYSAGRTFLLETNLDLSGLDFSPVPYFAGTFDGADHRITGIRLTSDGSRQGLFRVIAEGAEVKDLTVYGSVTPGGTACSVGGIVGVNYGTLSNCQFKGTISGIEDVGGIAGRNEASGTLTRCISDAQITGEHQVGGIVGRNDGTLYACESLSLVNTVPITPSEPAADFSLIKRQFDLAQLSEDDFLNLSNIGGIAGSSTGILDHCRNHAAVGYRSTGYNVGGIAGKSSGFVRSCSNDAEINGRRDTGGIVGQLIPFSDWDLSSGKLDALSQQVDILNSYINGAAVHTAYYSQAAVESLARLQQETASITDAVQGIVTGALNSDIQVIDSIVVDPLTGMVHFAAPDFGNVDTSALTYSLSSLYAESQVLTDIARSSTGTLSSDLYTIANQVSNVFNVLFSTVSTLGDVTAETTDLSRSEAFERNTGAISLCANSGAVIGENNCGGILGTAAFEVEFDMEDRLNVSDYLTSNARHNLFAAVRGCTSCSRVESKNATAGGIVGNMDIGIIVDSVFIGSASAGNGDYVGGIAGSSAGTILDCWSRCLLSGEKYIGGIAGYGNDIESTRVWVHFAHQNEFAGAVAGWADGKLIANLYVRVTPGGVDGISISGSTDPISERELLALEGVPEEFGHITVSYRKDGAILSTEEIAFGGSPSAIPEIQNRDGEYWVWDLPDEPIFAPVTVDGAWHAPGSTLSTSEDPPHFLAEGRFYDGQGLTVLPLDANALPGGANIPGLAGVSDLSAYTISVNDYTGDLVIRMLAPSGGDLYLLDRDGVPQPCAYTRDGRYLLFSMRNGGTLLYSAREAESGFSGFLEQLTSHIPLLVGGAAVILILLILLLVRRKKKKRAAKASRPRTAAKGDARSHDNLSDGNSDHPASGNASDGSRSEADPADAVKDQTD